MTGRRIVADLNHVPTYGFGSASAWYWATVGFMLIEGMAFVLAMGAYIYLIGQGEAWPYKSPDPNLWAGTMVTLLVLASAVPNYILGKAARKQQLGPTRFWAVVLCLFTAAVLLFRAFEFANLNTRWDFDPYGSIVWALILMHTAHLVTDAIGTYVMTVFLFTHPVGPERFSDVDDDCLYWSFVIVTWLPIYVLIYWSPRWLG